MELIRRLEKSTAFWSIFLISIVFFFLRLPSLFEPNWYGDEGIYQIIGIAINNGRILYSQIWDNKPPLLYLTYALFNGNQFEVRLFSLIIGLLSVWLFFYFAQKLFESTKISAIATTVFSILFAIPLMEGNIANAENFMLLPIIAAAVLIFKNTNSKSDHKSYALSPMLFAGLLLGIAFLFKIVAIFDLGAFLVFIFIASLATNKLRFNIKFRSLVFAYCSLLIGFLLPLLITIIYFVANHALGDFIRATFFGNIGYVGYGNKLIIPQGLLILKLLILAIFVLFILLKRDKFSKSSIFILIWLAFSLFNALFSQRPYTHYMLVLLPSFCLLLGLIFNEKKAKIRNLTIFSLLIVVVAITITFKPFQLSSLKKSILYYQNAFLFITDKKDVYSYQAFFDTKTPRDYQLASFIKMHTNANDHVFIWGDSAQIYVLSKTLPINKYTVAYHITGSKDALLQTQKDLDKIKPKYVIILQESSVFPFRLTNYVSKFSLTKAAIYERSL